MRALITGASVGIGRATAERLAGPGDELLLHYHRHATEVAELVESLRARQVEAEAFSADLGNMAAVDRLAGRVRARWDRLDVLVLNAGIYPRRRFDELSDDEWLECFRVNLFGPVGLLRRLLPLLARAPHSRIVFVSSVLAHTGSRQVAHYAGSKAAILGVARSLARELAPNLTVNVVAPGSIDTAILAGDTPERRVERGRSIPLGRIGEAKEVAEAVAFLVSPSASYITGTTLHVNGGAFPS